MRLPGRGSKKYPQAYFGGAVALAKAIRLETGEDDAADGFLTPEQIMSAADRRPDYHSDKRESAWRV